MTSMGPILPSGANFATSATSRGSAQAKKEARIASSSSDATPENLRAAQSNLADRINETNQQASVVAAEGEAQVNSLRDGYERETAAESSREELQLESERLKGYKAIRDLQRAQAAELARVKKQGDDELKQAQDYYRTTTYKTQRSGDEQVQELQNQNSRMIDYERRSGGTSADQMKRNQNLEIQQLQAERNERISALEADSQVKIDEKRVQTQRAMEQSFEHLNQNYVKTEDDNQAILGKVQTEASKQLQNLRSETAKKLAAYSTRQKDPFYQPKDLDAELSDHGTKYVLRAKIPDYERGNINVAVRGNQIVLSGSRRNEDKWEDEPGHVRGTNSYQSFNETFPFRDPVEANLITKEFSGDTVTVTIPKKENGFGYQPYKMKVARAEVQKPNFPENLPHTADPDSEPSVASKTGGRPLG